MKNLMFLKSIGESTRAKNQAKGSHLFKRKEESSQKKCIIQEKGH